MKSVTCVICGFEGLVKIRHVWEAEGHKWPDIFICDNCRSWN